MMRRAKSLWIRLTESLGFVPGLIVALFAVGGVALVEIDRHFRLGGVGQLFGGDGPAARTVLSVVAGSLITVAGLTFSITMVVLQLASSQFSPRVLRTFFADRITQVTIGFYVGTFAYSMIVLRAIGAGFVPRLSVTVASVLGIAAVVLLIVFLHHVSQMIQVSHVSAAIARATLARVDDLYPASESRRATFESELGDVLDSWRTVPPGVVRAARPGYVRRVELTDLAGQLHGRAERAVITVCGGDFVGAETSKIAEVWPAGAAGACREPLRNAIAIDDERDLDQDVDFGLRQLADTAMRAMSPGTADPMTAVTGVRYLSSILRSLAARPEPVSVHTYAEHGVTIAVRRRAFTEHLEVMAQLGRFAAADAWVTAEMLMGLAACSRVAHECGAHGRVDAIVDVASALVEAALDQVRSERDRTWIRQSRMLLPLDVDRVAGGPTPMASGT